MRKKVDYSYLTGQEKEEKCLNDIEDYLGEDKFGLLIGWLKSGFYTKNEIIRHIMILGIDGYPLNILIEMGKFRVDNQN